MSIIKSIKGTLKTVQEDFSEGLKVLTSPTQPKPLVIKELPVQSSLINYEAAGHLLHKHEAIWKDLYQHTETSAKRAQDIDVEIGKLFVYYDKQSEVLGRLKEEAANLPILLNQLQDITDTLAHVEEECDKVEAGLVHLENTCEIQEFQRNQASHNKQLAVYKMKKDHELQTYRVQLARSHAMKVEQTNKRKEDLLKEKQMAFEDQFTQDVDYFKKHGKPGRSPSTPEAEKKLDLADIQIEEDPEALNTFLASGASDTALSDTKENSESDVLSDGEGPSVEVTSPCEDPDVETVSPQAVVSPSEQQEVETSNQSESQTAPPVDDTLQDQDIPESALNTETKLPSEGHDPNKNTETD